MRINLEDVTKRANELYAEANGWTWDGYSAPETWPQIQSTQVKSMVQALVEAINRELFHPITVATDDENLERK